MAVPATVRRGANPGHAAELQRRAVTLAAVTCRIPDMASGRKAKRVRRQRRTAATPRTSPRASASHSNEAQPAPSRWEFLAVWERHPVLLGAALCAMVAVSHYPSLLAGFVLDDDIFAEAPAVHAWSGLWNIWFSPSDIEGEGHYWPITYTTFWLEHKLWGLTPFGTHLVNVLLYMVNVLLLWRLLRLVDLPGAWAVARGIRGPSHACRVGGLGHRTQGPALRPFLHGRSTMLDPFYGRRGR